MKNIGNVLGGAQSIRSTFVLISRSDGLLEGSELELPSSNEEFARGDFIAFDFRNGSIENVTKIDASALLELIDLDDNEDYAKLRAALSIVPKFKLEFFSRIPPETVRQNSWLSKDCPPTLTLNRLLAQTPREPEKIFEAIPLDLPIETLENARLIEVVDELIDTSARDETLTLLRSKFDADGFIRFVSACVDASDRKKQWASIVFNAPEEFPIELILKLWSSATQDDQTRIFHRRREEMLSRHLQSMLEDFAKGELPKALVAELEDKFGAERLVMLTVESVDKKFFSSKIFNYMITLREKLPVEIIIKFWSHAAFKDKFTALERYAKEMPREQLIVFANELVRDEPDLLSMFGTNKMRSLKRVINILRAAFDTKEFIEVVTECAAWSVEHDADKIRTVSSTMPLFEMHFVTMPLERKTSPPRQWAHFIFNAPERFPIEIIIKLFPYAWMYDRMTAMERYFYDFPPETRRELGYALVNARLDREELPSFTTTRMWDIMERTRRFAERQEIIRRRLQRSDNAEEEPDEELFELPRAKLFKELPARIARSLEPSKLAEKLDERFDNVELIQLVGDLKQSSNDERTRRACAAIVFNSSKRFPSKLVRELIAFASLPEKCTALERYFISFKENKRIELVNELLETKFAGRIRQVLRSKLNAEEFDEFIRACEARREESLKRSESKRLELADGDDFDAEAFIDQITDEYRRLKKYFKGSDSDSTVSSIENK